MPIKDKEARNAYLRERSKQNKDKVRETQYRFLEKYPEKKLLKASRGNAKARNLEHSITLDDIIIPIMCPYLEIQLTSKVESCNHPTTCSLDRIDSSKGYIPGNVQVISRLANLMKSNASEEQLLTFAKNVIKIHETTKTPS